MSDAISYAQLSFDADGTPESTRHGDVYFSRGKGLAESQYVFLHNNHFPQRWQMQTYQRRWVVAETGFGTGLNFFLTAEQFLAHAPKHAHLQFISFEKFPLSPSDFQQATSNWAEYSTLRNAILEQYPELLPGFHRLTPHPRITLDLFIGDVLDGLPTWAKVHQQQVDAWYLDGFAPSKNPDMWQPELYRAIAKSLKAQGSLATFTATGSVRRGLISAGLRMFKVAGFANKREMLRGYKQTPQSPRQQPEAVHIIGSGIAAACLFTELRDFPGELVLHQATEKSADGASGNPQAAVYAPLQAQWNRFSEFYAHAFVYARRFYQRYSPSSSHWCGVELLSRSADDQQRQLKLLSVTAYPSSLIQQSRNGLFMPSAGWLFPALTIASLIERTIAYRQQRGLPYQVINNSFIKGIERQGNHWKLHSDQASYLTSDVAFCTGYQGVEGLVSDAQLSIRPVRGQITQLRARNHTEIEQVLCKKGYVLPPQDGVLCTGATFDKTNINRDILAIDNEQNIEQLRELLPEHYDVDDIVGARASIRATTPDHLPLVGSLCRRTETQSIPYSGLWVLSGLGSRGFTSAPIAAALLAAKIMQHPMALSADIIEGLEPGRFHQRALKKTN